MRRWLLLMTVATLASAQNRVDITVDANQRIAPYKPIYGYFGYDEPNFTYSASRTPRRSTRAAHR